MKITKLSNNQQKGFTIVELLIATSVFAVVMLVLMFGVIDITNAYYKGITQSNTQNTARNILNDISQAIQFDGGIVTTQPAPNANIASPSIKAYTTSVPNTTGFCIGSYRYSYILGYQMNSNGSAANHQAPHSIVVDSVSGCSNATVAQNINQLSVTGNELMSQNMRLANLTITNLSNNYYSIDVRVVYGADNVLSNPTGTKAICKGTAGDRFCAAAELSTVVQKRVN